MRLQPISTRSPTPTGPADAVGDDSSVRSLAGRAARLSLVLAPFGVALLLSLPICPSALLARIPCPGCGLTRATLALLSGDLAAATAFNPIAIVVCPLLAGAALYAAYRYLRRGHVHADEWHAGSILVLSMVALTIVWLARWFGYFGGPLAL